MPGAVHIDVSSLHGFSRDLRAAEPEVAALTGKRLKNAGEIVADEMRGLTSWSTRIPGSIRTQRAGMTVSVLAGGGQAPHAAPYDHGGEPGTFRHPVFGDKSVWVSQTARPFTKPALDTRSDAVVAAVGNAIDDLFDMLAG